MILAPGAKQTPHPATIILYRICKSICYIRLPTSSCLDKTKQDNFLEYSEIFALSHLPASPGVTACGGQDDLEKAAMLGVSTPRFAVRRQDSDLRQLQRRRHGLSWLQQRQAAHVAAHGQSIAASEAKGQEPKRGASDKQALQAEPSSFDGSSIVDAGTGRLGFGGEHAAEGAEKEGQQQH